MNNYAEGDDGDDDDNIGNCGQWKHKKKIRSCEGPERKKWADNCYSFNRIRYKVHLYWLSLLDIIN